MRTFFITLLLVIVSLSTRFHNLNMKSVPTGSLRSEEWTGLVTSSKRIRHPASAKNYDILDRLKAANFNTVLLQTRLRGDMIYPSAIETFAESLTGSTGVESRYDPLAFKHRRMPQNAAWNYMHGLLRFLPETPVKYNLDRT